MSSANSDTFTSFPIWIPFFFLVWLPWLGLPKLYWIKVLRVDILGLLLILKEILSVFHYCKWCLLWVCYIWPLLLICWGKFTLSPLSEEFYHKWVLNFVKNFALSIGWSYGFIIQFVNMVYHFWCSWEACPALNRHLNSRGAQLLRAPCCVYGHHQTQLLSGAWVGMEVSLHCLGVNCYWCYGCGVKTRATTTRVFFLLGVCRACAGWCPPCAVRCCLLAGSCSELSSLVDAQEPLLWI